MIPAIPLPYRQYAVAQARRWGGIITAIVGQPPAAAFRSAAQLIT